MDIEVSQTVASSKGVQPIKMQLTPRCQDSLLLDSKLSAALCAIQILVVALLALYWYETWPIIDILRQARKDWLTRALELLDTVGSFFSVIFWCTRPSCKTQWAVALSWMVLLLGIVLATNPYYIRTEAAPHLILGTFAIPCMIALLFRVIGLTGTTEPALYEYRLKWLVITLLLLIVPIYPALLFGQFIHPKTFDLFALHFDVLLCSQCIPKLRTIIDNLSGAPTILFLAYGLTPLGFLATAIRQLKGKPAHVASAILVWVVSSLIAVIAYHFFPITGPAYVFEDMSHAFLQSTSYPLEMVSPHHGARNGMPSMHFGWMVAASILWYQTTSNLYSTLIFIIQTVLVLLATLYFGEHYLIDLIVASPFTLSLIALCSSNLSFRSPQKITAIFAGFFMWLFWVTVLRTQLEFIMTHPFSAPSLVALTGLVVAWQTYLISQFKSTKASLR